MNKRIHKILFTGFSVIAICTYLVSNKHFDFSREKKVDPIEIGLIPCKYLNITKTQQYM